MHTAWLLSGLVLLGLVLRLPGYGQSVWSDEVNTSNLQVGGNLLLLKNVLADSHPPVYFAFISLWNRLFGDGPLLLRLPPLLFGLASLPLAYRLGRRFVSHRVGLATALLLTLSPVHVWYSREARPYTAILLLGLCTVLAFLRLQRPGAGRRSLALYALGLVLWVFSHYYVIAFVPMLAAITWASPTPRRRSLQLVHGAVLALFALYAWAKSAFTPLQTGSDFLRAFDLGAWYELFFRWFPTGNAFWPRVLPEAMRAGGLATARQVLGGLLELLVVLVFLRGLWRLLGGAVRAERPRWPVLGLACAVPLLLLALPWIGFPDTYVERSAVAALPFYLVVLATGLVHGLSTPRARAVVSVTVALAALILGTQWALRDLWTVYKPHPDWKGLADHLAVELDRGAAGRPLFVDGANPQPLPYYDPRFQPVDVADPPSERIERFEAGLVRVFGAESALTTLLGRTARDMLAEYADHKERRWAGCRMPLHRLRGGSLEDLAPIVERGADGRFYLLFHRVAGEAPPDAHPVFDHPQLEVRDVVRFRSLWLFEAHWHRESRERAPS